MRRDPPDGHTDCGAQDRAGAYAGGEWPITDAGRAVLAQYDASGRRGDEMSRMTPIMTANRRSRMTAAARREAEIAAERAAERAALAWLDDVPEPDISRPEWGTTTRGWLVVGGGEHARAEWACPDEDSLDLSPWADPDHDPARDEWEVSDGEAA